ncbi:MAG: biotin--[acetyl-CoA-carboxylase] ligase [Bacteroidota bacterium]
MINTFGEYIVNLDEVDSTNNYAKSLLCHNSVPQGSVVSALHQTAGRGSGGTSWWCPKGQGLLLTYILYPGDMSVSDHFVINQAVSLALADFIRSYVRKKVFVKWPNDILVDQYKIAGILIENRVKGNSFDYVLAGVGVNVYQEVFPAHIPYATSIKLNGECGDPGKLLIDRLSGYLHVRFNELMNGEYMTLKNDYMDVLWKLNKLHLFRAQSETFYGIIRDVNRDGQIIIERKNGRQQAYGFKEVVFALFSSE